MDANIKLIEKIEEMYTEFFNECKNNNRCNSNREEYNDGYQYNHGMILTENYINSKNRLLIIGQEKTKSRYEKTIILKDGECKNNHWKRTLITAIKFFNNNLDINCINESEKAIIQAFNNGCEFAFTNFYKCAYTTNGKWSGSSMKKFHKIVGKQCIKCLINEINIIKPTLIIIQGKFAVPEDFNEIGKKEKIKEKNNISMWKFVSDNNSIYIIFSYHPCARKGSSNWYIYKQDLFYMIDCYYNI